MDKKDTAINLFNILKSLTQTSAHTINQVTSLSELEELRIKLLGRQGALAQITEDFKKLSPEDKKELGPHLQTAKEQLHASVEAKKNELENAALQKRLKHDQFFDVTAYTPGKHCGSLHPLTRLIEEVHDIFISMGYQIVRGPELETDWYNFEALNIPSGHPARDMWDTLWIDNMQLLLRTHTSTMQIRAMEHLKPPFAIAAAGRVYRYEATDATHDYMFHQLEGLVIGPTISMADLLGTVKSFFRTLFSQANLELRIRPGYFPFVEPGIEIDISCPFCTQGCSICKHSRWIEMCGAGLVHPNVLKFTQIDTTNYSGFAFGAGLSRIAMLKYNINDIRLLASGKLEFLRQF